MGCPLFNSVQIRSGGQELEDIQEYGRLYAMLMAVQSSRLAADEYSLTQNDGFQGAATSYLGTTKNNAFFEPTSNSKEDIGTKLAVNVPGQARNLWMAAYDFETFAKSATESGINSADRALPVTTRWL
jgi:hypothetical protein